MKSETKVQSQYKLCIEFEKFFVLIDLRSDLVNVWLQIHDIFVGFRPFLFWQNSPLHGQLGGSSNSENTLVFHVFRQPLDRLYNDVIAETQQSMLTSFAKS